VRWLYNKIAASAISWTAILSWYTSSRQHHKDNVRDNSDSASIKASLQSPTEIYPAHDSQMAGHAVQAVDAFGELLVEMLHRAEEIKQTPTVEPPLNKSDLANILDRVESSFFSSVETLELRKRSHAAIDIAIREKFNDLLVSFSPVRMWKDPPDHL
jgi:hypothetical protein